MSSWKERGIVKIDTLVTKNDVARGIDNHDFPFFCRVQFSFIVQTRVPSICDTIYIIVTLKLLSIVGKKFFNALNTYIL